MFNLQPTKYSFISMAAGLLLMSCSSDTTLGSKTIDESQTFDIPGATDLRSQGFPVPAGVLPLPAIEFAVDPASQPGYDDDDLNFVTGVSVRSITFEIDPLSSDPSFDPGDDGNLDSFDFVSELVLSLVADVGGEQQVVEIARLPMNDPQIASNAQVLQMNVQNADIRDLIEADGGCNLRVNITGSVPPDRLKINADIRFKVNVGIRS